MSPTFTSACALPRQFAVVGLVASLAWLGGCAATQVAIAKRDLDVQTKMSATIFLDPVKELDRTVYVQVRNTSDKQDLDVASDIAAAVAAKGYRVVTDPDAAHYYLQANVLYVGKTSSTASESALRGGYGGPLGGALIGATAGSAFGNNSGRSLAGAALIGGLVETVAGSVVKDVYYSIVTDVQIKERLARGQVARLDSQQNLQQGTGGTDKVSYAVDTEMRAHQTRVISTANKVNLDFAEAVPPLRAGLTRALGGLF